MRMGSKKYTVIQRDWSEEREILVVDSIVEVSFGTTRPSLESGPTHPDCDDHRVCDGRPGISLMRGS